MNPKLLNPTLKIEIEGAGEFVRPVFLKYAQRNIHIQLGELVFHVVESVLTPASKSASIPLDKVVIRGVLRESKQ